MTCVEDLAELLAIPGQSGDTVDWRAVESSLGRRLPGDYKELIEHFPDGLFRGLIQLNRPGDQNYPPDDFLGFYAYNPLGDMRSWRESGHGSFPYPIHPEPGGVLPWARVRGLSGHLFWLTERDDPDKWPVVMTDREFVNWWTFDGGACEILLQIVQGRFDLSMFGRGTAEPLFMPVRSVSAQPSPAQEGPSGAFWQKMLGARLGHPTNRFPDLQSALGTPTAVAPVDWATTEEQLGLSFPADYKSFANAYGAGTFCDISIAVPGAAGSADFADLLQRSHAHLRASKRPGVPTPPIYPDPGGMIPWGDTVDGMLCAWLPLGPDPDRWGTVVSFRSRLRYHPEAAFAKFLTMYADGQRVVLLRKPWPQGSRFLAAEQ
jgi:hypothetical protein